jgi:hypothetical protein
MPLEEALFLSLNTRNRMYFLLRVWIYYAGSGHPHTQNDQEKLVTEFFRRDFVNVIPFPREKDPLLDTYKTYLFQDKKGQTAEDYGYNVNTFVR